MSTLIQVSAGLEYMIEKEGRREENRTTAWLISTLRRWFDLMTSRHPVLALSRMNSIEFKNAMDLLQTVIKIFKGVKIGDGNWKPSQTGWCALKLHFP